MTAAIIIVLHLKTWVHLPVPTASLHRCILHWVAQRKYTNPILYIMELVIRSSRYKFQPHPLPFTTLEYSKCRFYCCSKWPFNEGLAWGAGVTVFGIRGNLAPPFHISYDILHPPGIFGTPYELGIMVPPYQISELWYPHTIYPRNLGTPPYHPRYISIHSKYLKGKCIPMQIY